MESTAKCLTGTTSVAWRRVRDGDGRTAVVVVDHELRPADWRSAERGDDGGRAQSGGVV